MNDKVVTVLFRGGLHARVERYQFFQYDTGRKLYFGDVELPFSYEVHFANKLHGVDAMTQIGDSSGVDVPAAILKSGDDIYAWLWLDGMTEGVIYIPVDKRAKPGNPAPEPDPPDIIEQALAVLNEGIDHVDEALEDTEEARDSAEASASAAQVSATQAASSASNAATSAISASDSASSAASSASVASRKAIEASDRATIALTSSNIAQTAATTATNVLNNIDDAIDTALTEAKESGEFDGPKGDKGDPGDDGYSPIAAVTQLSSGATITITDQNGTTTASIFNGHDGIPGRDGVNGAPGQDGFSPTAMVSKSGDTATISITDANGTTTATIQDGATGQTGPQGDPGTPGVGVPSGGTAGQVLSKASGTDYDTEWTTPSGGDVTDVQVNGVSVVSGGVANVPIGSNSVFGVFQTAVAYGTTSSSGQLRINAADNGQIKNGEDAYKPVVPSTQHRSTFYGLAKAAGDTTQSRSSNAVGTYTDSAKSSISQMLNSPVTISGSTPTITALPGVRYVCGEVATLDITLPASGCVDIVFESGSTATVLTITPPTGQTVKWANGFDPTALDANTTYEINIADGLGVAASWT